MEIYLLEAERVSEEDVRFIRDRFPERYARAGRCAKSLDGLCIIAAGVLLYRVLGIENERMLQKTPEGRPYIDGGPAFSLSHSGNQCVLAVGAGKIGVDIERIDESNLIAAPVSLTEAELQWIRPSPPERFHILWTRKESVYKAVGGFSDPKDIEVLKRQAPKGFTVRSVLLPGYALSICSEEAQDESEPVIINKPF